MAFQNLNKEELSAVAEFFAVEVTSAKDEPSKNEIIAALNSGDEPVTWEDYNNIYLVAKKDGEDKVENDAPDLTAPVEEKEEDEPVELDYVPVLVLFTGQNPRYDVAGHTVTKKHPFLKVHPDTAEYLVRNHPFRLALPSEVADFYN